MVEPVAARAAEPAEPVAPVEPAGDVMVPIVDEDDIPLTWDPVPVPRPTYTMKAKAERPEVAPAAVTPDPAAGRARERERRVVLRRTPGRRSLTPAHEPHDPAPAPGRE